MSIIGSFPTTLANGQPEDATQVMSLFTWIQSQVNGNACAATTTTNILKGDGSGNTTSAISGTDYLAPNADFIASAGSTNAYTATFIPALTGLVEGLKVRLKANFANTGAATFNPNSLGAKPIVDYKGNSLVGGEILSLGNIELTYNTSFNSGSGAWVLNLLETQLAIFLGTMSTQNSNSVAITGGTISGLSSPLPVASGGIGIATLPANNVLLGNGVSALQSVAPSTSGNVLTSNGSTWTSSPLSIKGLGLGGETWHDVTSSRTSGSTYTNSNSYPIAVLVSTSENASAKNIVVTVNGVQIVNVGSGGSGFISSNNVTFIVPPGATYKIGRAHV